jgi:serine/threonine-protein kinase
MASSDEPTKSSAGPAKDATRGTPARKSERPSIRPGGPQSLIGVTLSGRYKIERLLGEGGMGAVYQAEHTHMRKRLAIKVLHPEMSRLSEVVARFEREAMAAAHIEHPNVATATDFGKLDDGSFFLALEFVEGHSLREAIGHGRMELGRVLHIVAQIASALGRAHQLGIVHRDLKPENVMLVEREGDTDFVKVLDFGIAKVPVGELGTNAEASKGQPVLTQLGMVYGTPEYMAPEQALGQDVDARADLYALGVIMFEMLSGERPFDAESKVQLLGMHVTAPVPSVADRVPEARIPREVEAIVLKLLEKEASNRYADARMLVDAITAIEAQLVAHGLIEARPALVGVMSGPMSAPMSPQGAPLPRGSAAKISMADASSSYPSLSGVNGPTLLRSDSAVRVSLARVPPALSRVWSGARTEHKVMVIGGAAAVLLVLFVIVVVVGMSGGGTAPSASGSASANASASAAPSASISPDHTLEPQFSVDTVILLARTNVEKGNYASAIESLAPLAAQYPRRSDIHQLLEKAYAGAKNNAAAMREAGLWIDTDPQATDDLKLLEDIRNTALAGKDGADIALSLLEEKLGAAGPDILYDVAYLSSGQLYPAAAARARAALAKPTVRAIASRALAVLLDFKDAKTCDAKHALLERARDEADWRMVPVLKQYSFGRGCGFLSRSDCWPCMRRDGALKDAMAAIDARSPKK